MLRWAAEARKRLAQLDVSEASPGLPRRVDDLAGQVAEAAAELSACGPVAATGLAEAVTAELSGPAMADADFTVSVSAVPAREDDTAPVRLLSGAGPRRLRWRRSGRVRLRRAPGFPGGTRMSCPDQERLRW